MEKLLDNIEHQFSFKQKLTSLSFIIAALIALNVFLFTNSNSKTPMAATEIAEESAIASVDKIK